MAFIDISQRLSSVLTIVFLVSFSFSSAMRIPSSALYNGHVSSHDIKMNSKRSLVQLAEMVEKVIPEHEAVSFIGYGNWCGPGGEGEPVDAIDKCCKYHDKCYDRTLYYNVCAKKEKSSVYKANYEWKNTKTGNVACGDNPPGCEAAICLCDTRLVNCLKKHILSFSETNKHSLNLQQFLEHVMTDNQT